MNFLLFVLILTCFPYISLGNGVDVQAGLTKPTEKQRKDIQVLISKIDFDQLVAVDSRSTYTTHKGTGSGDTFRLDNEMKTTDKPPRAKMSIQLNDNKKGSPTYATLVATEKVNFGKNKIRNAFVKSLDSTKVEYLV